MRPAQSRPPKFDITYLLLLPFITSTFIPYVSRHIRILYTFPFLAYYILLFLLRPKPHQYKDISKKYLPAFIWFAAFYGLDLFYSLLGRASHLTFPAVAQYVGFLSISLVSYISFRFGKIRELKFITLYLLACLIVGALFTIRAESQAGDVAMSRTLTGMGSENSEMDNIIDAYLSGTWGYSKIYGVGILVPLLFYSNRFLQGRRKSFNFMLLILFILVVYHAQYSILVACLGASLITVGLVSRFASTRVAFFVSALVFFSILIFVVNPGVASFVKTPLKSLSESTDNELYQHRLDSVLGFIENDPNSYAHLRRELYRMSWNSFLADPLLGVTGSFIGASGRIGGHSMLLDLVGRYGLLGLSLFTGFIYNLYGYLFCVARHHARSDHWEKLFVIYFCIFLCIAFLNPLRGYLINFLAWNVLMVLPMFYNKQPRTLMQTFTPPPHDYLS